MLVQVFVCLSVCTRICVYVLNAEYKAAVGQMSTIAEFVIHSILNGTGGGLKKTFIEPLIWVKVLQN